MRVFLLLVATTLIAASCSRAQEFPLLPTQFSATIEANIVNRGYAVEQREYWDEDNNRLRLERHAHDNSVVSIYHFDDESHYRVEDGECSVTNTTTNFRDGFLEDESGHHLRSARDMFEQVDRATYVYMGTGRARGVPCEKWHARLDTAGVSRRSGHAFMMNMTLDWFFADDSWRVRGESETHGRPVRLIVNGTVTREGDTHAFEHWYEWVDFVPGAPDESMFHVPRGHTFCPMLVQKELPPLPDSFSLAVEITSQTNQRTRTMREWRDYDQNMVRLEHLNDDGETVATYLDFGKDAQFVVEDGDCKITSISEDYQRFYNTTLHHVFHESYGRLDPSYTATYGGQTYMRGILTDHWRIEHGDLEVDGGTVQNYTQDMYFPVDDWKFNEHEDSDENDKSKRLPIAQFLVFYFIDTEGTRHFRHFDYQLVDSFIGSLSDEAFDLPHACDPDTDSSENGISTGAAAGIAVVVGLIAFAAGLTLYHLRVKAQNRHRRLGDTQMSEQLTDDTNAE